MKAVNLSTKDMEKYRDKRKAEGVKHSTINRELSALRRMYNLGLKQDPPLVTRIPKIPLIPEDNVRTGFFTLEEFLSLRGAMPDHLKVVTTIGYYTGMRLGEITGLQWKQVDLDRGLLRLDPGTTKNKEGRVIPLMAEVLEVLNKWWTKTSKEYPGCPWVCHYQGEQYIRLTRAWKTACKQIGLEGRLFHDLRRSAVRNLVRAGVSQVVAKKISGHKTDSVFSRYNIVSESDLMEATEKLSRYVENEKAKIGLTPMVKL